MLADWSVGDVTEEEGDAVEGFAVDIGAVVEVTNPVL